MNIPLFPLSTVVMPGGLLPLRLFEPRYLDMVRDCFRQETGFGVCLLKGGSEVGPAAQPYPLGTLVKIVDWDQDSDGLLNIVIEGEQKFRLMDIHVEKSQLIKGAIELLPQEVSTSLPAEYTYLKEVMLQVLAQVSPKIKYPDPQLDDALWLGSRFVELLPMATEVRQELVEMDESVERLAAVAEWLAALSNNRGK